MRPTALLATLASLVAGALVAGSVARAAALDLPVARAGAVVEAPYYRGDVIEVRLAPAAARALLPRGAGATRAVARGRTGMANLDAVAATVGAVAFEPEFRGETPPSDAGEPDFTAFQLVHLAPDADLATALDAFRALPEVLSADPIAVLPVSAMPNDSLVFATWWLHRDQAVRTDIRAPEAWAVESGDTNIVVGVLDTGVIPFHPDLGGRAGERGNLYINWAERAGLPGVDDDGNGYVDDFGGWDFVVLGTLAAAGEDARNEDNDPNDWGGHGTAVAGVIGAVQDNGIGLAGVAPRVRIMPLRMGWLQSGVFPPAGVVDMSYAAAAIRYATRMGVHVLNCSWQSQNTGGLDAAVTAATRAGVVIVNASGNFGTSFTYLGQREDVIAVTATDSTDTVWSNAVRGPWVDLAAGGVNITSTMFQRLSATDSLVGRTPAYKGFINGTSFAAPQVAGAVALLQAQRRHQGLDPLTPMGANLRLRETTDDLSALNPLITDYGTGRLNLFRALSDPPRSLAIRTRSRSVGAPLTLRDDRGTTRVITAFADRTLLATDGVTGDTLWTALLPAAPTANLAAAQLPLPDRVVIASGSNTGLVTLLHEDGRIATGWPRSTATGVNLASGVCFADLDGDGRVEVVAAGTSTVSSRIWAWSIDGTPRAGFPFDPGTVGVSAVAAADLDGLPGDELAFLDASGALRVVRGDGSELTGFPSAPLANGRAPVIARLGGPGTPPSIVVASPNTLTAFAPDGSTRWTRSFFLAPTQDPALADLDGDGVDEIVLANASPPQIMAFDSSGTTRPGWPVAMTNPALGPLVVGPLTSGGGLGVMAYTTTGLVAWSASGQPVRGFPRPGLAGVQCSLDDLDGDGATEVAAGTAVPDSNQYTYDAGPGTFAASALVWPTVRGGAARTASHARGTPPAFTIDLTAPGRITDLEARTIDNTSVSLRFTHTGDDGFVGTAARLELRAYQGPLDDANFAVFGTLLPPIPPRPAGTLDSVVVHGLPEGTTRWFALRAFDRFERGSEVSNSDSASLPGVAPGGVRDLRATATNESTVVLTWLASGGDGDLGRPLRYRIAGAPGPLDSASFAVAPVQRLLDATRDAGQPETLMVDRLTPGRRWRFAVIAVDAAFSESPMSTLAEAVTPVGGAIAGRTGFTLAARPLPASAEVTVDWQGDPSGTVPQWLEVHDLAGRLRRRVSVGTEPGGSWQWNGRDEEGVLVPAGLYFVRLVSGSRHATSRVVFVR